MRISAVVKVLKALTQLIGALATLVIAFTKFLKWTINERKNPLGCLTFDRVNIFKVPEKRISFFGSCILYLFLLLKKSSGRQFHFEYTPCSTSPASASPSSWNIYEYEYLRIYEWEEMYLLHKVDFSVQTDLPAPEQIEPPSLFKFFSFSTIFTKRLLNALPVRY